MSGLGPGTALGADHAATVLSLGPAAYWRLNEITAVPAGNRARNLGTTGTAADGFYNGTSLHPVTGALVASPNGAAAFDGLDGSYVSVANLDALNPTAPFSVEAWVKPNVARPNDDSVACPLASLWRTTVEADGWIFYQMASAWSLRLGNSTNYGLVLNSKSVPQAGRWHHLVATLDGSLARLYVNGIEEASGQLTGSYRPNRRAPMGIGARGDNAFRFEGVLDEVAIYPVVLSTNDVLGHYRNALSPTPVPSYEQLVQQRTPLAYYRLADSAYTPPATLPTARNASSAGTALDGRYQPGMTNGTPGPRPIECYGFTTDNRAADFNGAGGSISTPLQLGGRTAFTVTGWVRRGASRSGLGGWFGDYGVLEVGETGTGETLQVRVPVYNSSIQAPYPFPTDRWGFVAVSATGTNVTLYTNGVPAGSLTGTVSSYGGSSRWFSIGAGVYGAAGDWFRGSLDEIAVFARALSATDLKTLYESAGVAPQISVQPQAPNDPVYAGNTVRLEVAAIGSPTLTYAWRKNGAALSGRTTPQLVLSSVVVANSGAYDVVVRNSYGAVTSLVANLEVLPANPPVIVRSPESRTRFVGAAVTFSVEAAGTPPLTYQWQFNGGNLSGQTAPTLALSNLTTARDGLYRVIVKNSLLPSGIASDAARLTVTTPPRYAAAVLADKPMAYWRLGETNGAVASDAWGGHDGQYSNVDLGLEGASAQDPDRAARFAPERDSHVAVANGTAFAFSGLHPTFTLEAWAKFDAVSGVQRLCSNRHTPDGPSGGYAFGIAGPDHLRFSAFGVQDLDSPEIVPPLLAGRWYHLAVTLDNGMITFYLNGRALGTAYGLASALVASPEPFQLGRNPVIEWGEQELEGTLDELVVYLSAVSPSRLQAHYQARDDGRVPPKFTVHPAPARVYNARPARFTAVAEGSAPVRYQWTVNGAPLTSQTNATLELAGVPGDFTVACLALNAAGTASSDSAQLEIEPLPSSSNVTNCLVLHLEFDSGFTDASGRGNHAQAVGHPAWIPGFIGSAALQYHTDALAIPKVFDYATLDRVSDLLFSTNINFTVAFWTRFTSLPDSLPFFANSANGLGDAGFTLAPSFQTGGWAWSLNDALTPKAWGGIAASSPGRDLINDYRWHHLAFTFDRASNAVTYLDGQPVSTVSLRPATGWNLDTGNPVNVGQASGIYPANGLFDIDDLGVWRCTLTPFDVDTIYLAGARLGKSLASDLNTRIQLEIQRVGPQIEIRWNSTGVLLTAPQPTGPWTANTNASSPFFVTPQNTSQFYRVRQ